MTSIFIFISGATLLVYSAERLISSLVGVSRGLRISVFLLAIIFTGIEFDDIVLGVALNLEDEQEVALGLVLGTAVSFTGIVLALGAILTPTQFTIPREYVASFAAAPLIMFVFALREEVTAADAVVLLVLFVAWIAYVAHREIRRETATFRNIEIVEEVEEALEEVADPTRAQAVSTMSPFSTGRYSGWLHLGMAVLALCGIIIGAATVSTGTDQILDRYGIEGTVFGATIVTAVLCIEDLFLTVQPIRKGVPEIGIGNVIGSLVFSVTGKLGIVVLAGGTIAIGSNTLRWHLPVLVGMTALAAYFLSTGQLKRWHGYVLLALYIAYWIVSFVVYGGAPVDD
ncbi:MAG: sodium:calcium antiporter [Candidatus Limnocylindria bacterium]